VLEPGPAHGASLRQRSPEALAAVRYAGHSGREINELARDLPGVRDTLLLRLLDHGTRFQRALAELDELPPGSPLRHRLVETVVAWRKEMIETSSEGDMIYPETKARYAEWKAKVLDEGIKKGITKGRREGKRELVRKLLMLRFGELPADAERRLERASPARLERWAERVLTARNLAAVFADPVSRGPTRGSRKRGLSEPSTGT
jgi:hypothetical protein